jgi:hypothetical protein
MKQTTGNLLQRSLAILLLPVCTIVLCSWGTWGHEHINKAAIFALPEEMRRFYYNHADFITIESTGPDMRRSTLGFKSEGPKHFIDIEAFDKPIDSLPQYPREETKIYDEAFLQKNGSLPWHIQDVMTRLTQAFKNRKKSEILLLSADLGHYLGDSQMPLHTTTNYDGQLTDQKGIHSFFESELVERFGEGYNLNTGEAHYIDDVSRETWRLIKASHQLVDTLLAIDRMVKQGFAPDKIYKTDAQGNVMKNDFGQKMHTDEYAKKFHDALNGMIEQQIRASITAVADFWYTAWVNGGRPDLNSLDDADIARENETSYKKDLEAWKKGRITKLKAEREF